MNKKPLALAFAAGIGLPLLVSIAFAQKPPTPPVLPPQRAFTVQPTPPPAPGAPLGPSVAGIATGAPMTAVDAKCKEAGVTCKRAVRRTAVAGALDRVTIELATGEFARVYVTGKAGTVLSVKGRYRADDSNRVTNMRKTLGEGTLRLGLIVWTPANAPVTEMDVRGQYIQYIDTKSASSKGFAIAPAAFVTAKSKLESIRPLSMVQMTPARGAGLMGPIRDLQVEQVPTPQVTNPLRIPVKITLGELRCYDENDPTSVFHGDDPYLNIVGTHTAMHPKAWWIQRTFSDVESGGHLNVNQVIFPEGDQRRFVTLGEAVGAQFTLIENDHPGPDDEIDFGYPIVDYAFALANQNKTLNYSEYLSGDGTVYTLAYKIEIGRGEVDNTAYNVAQKYRAVDPKLYAGTYAGSVGDGVSDATLTFLASRDPAYPNGVLYGSFKDGGQLVTLRTTRLQGDSIELVARYPSGNPGTLVGYLVGDGNDRRLVGTIVRDGASRGVALVKK